MILEIIIRKPTYVFVHEATQGILFTYKDEQDCLRSIQIHRPELDPAIARLALNKHGVSHPIGMWKRITP